MLCVSCWKHKYHKFITDDLNDIGLPIVYSTELAKCYARQLVRRKNRLDEVIVGFKWVVRTRAAKLVVQTPSRRHADPFTTQASVALFDSIYFASTRNDNNVIDARLPLAPAVGGEMMCPNQKFYLFCIYSNTGECATETHSHTQTTVIISIIVLIFVTVLSLRK
jgi:hypothetical protein